MLIEEYFGFKKHPFLNVVDLDFLFWSKEFKEGYARLLYSIIEAKTGLSLILGEIGCGKTMLCKALQKDIEERNLKVCFIENPLISPKEFLINLILSFFNEEIKGTKANLFKEIEKRVKKEDIGYVVLIDEAQILSSKIFEEIRLLLNIEKKEGKILNVVLFGQMELKKKLKKETALKQRIGISYTLLPLNKQETKEYINHRLKVAGKEEEIFDEKAIEEIYNFTNGIPRLINIICSNSLFAGFMKDKRKIDEEIVKIVIEDYKKNLE
jgi:general secretion pathway protein A